MFENTFKVNHKIPENEVLQILAQCVKAINPDFDPAKSFDLKYAEIHLIFSAGDLIITFTADVGYDKQVTKQFQQAMRAKYGNNCFSETHLQYDCELDEPVYDTELNQGEPGGGRSAPKRKAIRRKKAAKK
jgi:hypothetical protein